MRQLIEVSADGHTGFEGVIARLTADGLSIARRSENQVDFTGPGSPPINTGRRKPKLASVTSARLRRTGTKLHLSAELASMSWVRSFLVLLCLVDAVMVGVLMVSVAKLAWPVSLTIAVATGLVPAVIGCLLPGFAARQARRHLAAALHAE
jgi:hypothetical protein